MNESELNNLIDNWIKSQYFVSNPKKYEKYSWAYDELLDYNSDKPELVWKIILKILKIDNSKYILGMLSAGPLEDLLSYHEDQLINRVEKEAINNADFAILLGGIYITKLKRETQDRIKKVWNYKYWEEE